MDLVATADMLAADKDVGNGALPGHLHELSLDLRALLVLVQFDGTVGKTELVKQALRLAAVRAVALGEDLVDKQSKYTLQHLQQSCWRK